MSYIGNTTQNQNYVPAIDYFNGDGSTVAFTLSRPVASVAAVQAVISNVPQNPGSAFTVSGSTITFTSAPPSGTANIYVYYTSPNTQIVQPGQGTVGTTQLQSDLTLTNPTYTGTLTGGTGVVNIGSGQVYKDSSGNVGIGTSSPTTKLHIEASTGTARAITLSDTGGATPVILGNTISGGTANFVATVGGSERMRITSAGDVLVGRTTAGAGTGVGCRQDITGHMTASIAASTNADDTMHVYSIGASAYRFYVGGGGTIYATNTTISAISDQRYKENIRDLDVGLDAVMALKPRKFDWKKGKGADIKDARGFIAQEFEQVFPDLIDEWKDPAPEGEEPYKSVRQDLIPVLVKAIQELNAKVEAQAAEIAALKGAA